MSYKKTGVRALKGVIRGQPCTRVVADGIRTAEVDAIIGLAMDLGFVEWRAPCGLCPALSNETECREAALAYGPCGFNKSDKFMVWVADEYVPMLAMKST